MTTRRRETGGGFSVFELIVVLTCAIFLAGLAMPALMHLRAHSRMDNCGLRARLVCIAAHNFHDAWKRLPPATLGVDKAVDRETWANSEESEDYWKNQQNTSFLLLMAPFMELGRHYEQVHPGAFDLHRSLAEIREGDDGFDVAWQGDIDGISNIIEVQVDDLLCPDDNLAETSLPAVIATQPCEPFEAEGMDAIDQCNDIAVQVWDDGHRPLGLTNYVGCFGAVGGTAMAGDPDNARWRGALSSRKRMTLVNIQDGTSVTLMLGESLGDINDRERTAAPGWVWGGGGRVCGLLAAKTDSHDLHEEIGMLGDSRYSSSVGFGSKHDGVVFFALCDGSVRGISRDIDWQVLYNIAGAQDGETVDHSSF